MHREPAWSLLLSATYAYLKRRASLTLEFHEVCLISIA